MNAPATLCLTMIVRNDKANLTRCLNSLAGEIGCWMIGDAGSTDGSAEFIRAFFSERGLPGELFATANFDEVLDRACSSRLRFDYLLLTDAEMELVVEDHDFRCDLEAPYYDLAQRSGVGYSEARLLRRDAARRSEHRQAPSEGSPLAPGVWCKDHATGAKLAKKRAQDIRLLMRRIQQAPHNGRHWLCLARTLQDAGFTAEAAKAYAKRAGMGVRDDEAWYARLQEARCLLALNDESGFLRAALAAYNQSPLRAEPLYELAKFHRGRGMTNVGLLYAEAGLALDRPARDARFVEEFTYTTGLLEEYSIAAFYSPDPQRKERGHVAADWLALSRATTPASRQLARANVDYYGAPARTLMPSFRARPVGFTPPEGWQATNPSVAQCGDQLVAVQRCVNYTLDEDGEYRTANGAPIASRHFLLPLTADLRVVAAAEILPPADLPDPACDLVLGFENVRPFLWRGELWCCAGFRQLTPEGWCEQVLARIDCPPSGPGRLTDWCVLRPEGPQRHQTNWMPLVSGDELRFIASCDPVRVLNDQARKVSETLPPIAAELFVGGSQAIAFDRGWLALVHEISERAGKPSYWHRFVWFDAELALRGISRRFCLQQPGLECVSGFAWHPDRGRLVISFGLRDCEAWLATVDAEEVRAILSDTEWLSAAGPGGPTWRGLPSAEPVPPDARRPGMAPVWESAA